MNPDRTTIVFGPPGCIAGGSILKVNRAGKTFEISIRRLNKMFNGGISGNRKWSKGIETRIQSKDVYDTVSLTRIKKVWKSGTKVTLEIKTVGGRKLRATTDHRFLTKNGYKELGSITLSDSLVVNKGRSIKGNSPKKRYKSTYTKYHPNQRKAKDGFRYWTHRLSYEAHLNGMTFGWYISILNNSERLSKKLKFLSQEEHVHHKDENIFNNNFENLKLVTVKEHSTFHNWKNNVKEQVGLDQVLSINTFGIEDVFDIEVWSSDHNFIANEIVVHNCGKTTTLLNKVALYLNQGILAEEIGFVSFTKQACEEAKGRAADRFELKRKQLFNFRTLHSMAFQMLGLNTNSVIKYKHYQEVAHACGVNVTHRAARMNSEEGLWVGATHGDKILFLENLARISGITLEEALAQSEFEDITRIELELWSRTLRSYKNANALFDFTDMVTNWLEHGAMPKLKVLFVDEAQDLSKIQWEMVYKLANQDCDIWVAGDDDQAIFKWSGANPDAFVQLAGNRIVLHQSYRVPKVVHKLAMEFREQIPDSVPKDYHPTEEQGFLDFYADLEQINMDKGNWLILCRNNYLVSTVEETCRRLGLWYASLFDPPSRCTTPIINYTRFTKGERLTISELEEVLKMMDKIMVLNKEYDAKEFIEEYGRDLPYIVSAFQEKRPWFDVFKNMSVDKRAYYRSVLAKGTDIRGVPRLRISTIHGAKGGEEDNVVLITDISDKTFAKATLSWPDEYRVWYVAITRSKGTLHIVRPKTSKCLPLLAL